MTQHNPAYAKKVFVNYIKGAYEHNANLTWHPDYEIEIERAIDAITAPAPEQPTLTMPEQCQSLADNIGNQMIGAHIQWITYFLEALEASFNVLEYERVLAETIRALGGRLATAQW